EALSKKVGDGWNTPAGREIVWRLRSERCAPLLARIILDKNTPPEMLWHYFRAFDFIKGEAKNDAIMTVLDGAAGNKTMLVEALSRLKSLEPAKVVKIKPIVASMLDGAKGTAEFVQLVEQFDLKDRNEDLLTYAAEHPTDVAAGTAIKLVEKNDPKAIE